MTGDVPVTAKEIARRVDQAALRLVRFLRCGNDGTVRAKASARHGLEGRLEAGIGLTVAMQAMSGLDRLQQLALGFGDTPLERTVFVLGSGPGLRGVKKARVVDVLPTVLGQLGIRAKPAWNLDGRALGGVRRPASG